VGIWKGKTELKIDLGGGAQPYHGFINVDCLKLPTVDCVCNLETDILPFDDNSVDEIYSSHCLEHMTNHGHLLHELARVGRIGARFELRVPHWNGQMGMCAGHVCTVSEMQILHWCVQFVSTWWAGCSKRLRLVRRDYIPSAVFFEAAKLFPWLTQEQVMRFIPDAAHEIRFYMEVIANDPVPGA
jgi:ubiquinone/menaquinone biosynthesis C-methylase UbiE